MTSGKGSRGSHYSRDYIDEHADGFRYRRAVPTRLRPIIGKTVFCAWLGNVGRREAEERARPIATAHDLLIKRLDALTDAERREIVAATVLQGGRPPRIQNRKLVTEGSPGKRVNGLDAWTSRALFDTNIGLPLAQALIPLLMPDETIDDAAQLKDMKFAVEARARIDQMQAGVAAARVTAKKLTGQIVSLEGLVDLHTKVVAPKNPQTVDVYKRAVRRFVAAVGEREPGAVTRVDVIAFREYLEAEGKSAATIGKMIGGLSTLLNTALAEGIIEFNPAAKIKARPDPNRKFSDDKKPFSPEQLRLILARCGELRPDDVCVVRMMVYTGARSGELCPLRA